MMSLKSQRPGNDIEKIPDPDGPGLPPVGPEPGVPPREDPGVNPPVSDPPAEPGGPATRRSPQLGCHRAVTIGPPSRTPFAPPLP